MYSAGASSEMRIEPRPLSTRTDPISCRAASPWTTRTPTLGRALASFTVNNGGAVISSSKPGPRAASAGTSAAVAAGTSAAVVAFVPNHSAASDRSVVLVSMAGDAAGIRPLAFVSMIQPSLT
jgi:hypothetical protein